MTEQKKTEENLKTAVDRQKLVIDVLNLLNKQQAENDGIKNILDLVKHRTGVEALGIILHRDGEFRLHAITGIDENFHEKIESGCSLINNQNVEPGILCLCCRSLDIYNSNEAAIADESALFWSNNLLILTDFFNHLSRHQKMAKFFEN